MTTTELMKSIPSRDRGATDSGARWLLVVAALASAGVGALALAWLWRPAWNGFAGEETALLGAWLSPGQVAVATLGLAVLGVLAAGIALAYQRISHREHRWPEWLAVVGLLEAAVIVFGVLGVTVIMAAGYLMALLVPVGAVLVTAQLVRRGGVARWVALAAVAVVLVGGLATGVLSGDAMPLFGHVADLPGHFLRDASMPFLLAVTALAWTVVALRAAAGGGNGSIARWVLRHRTAITVVASLGPLPYAVVRLTWLTPWPQLAPGELPADARLWGLLLSSGAWAGFVLTLGLIQRWGEVFPAWMPRVAGRPVPVWFAAVPGGLVATIVTASAVPMVRMFLEQGTTDGLVSAVVFPFWLWGPALALAVWGYVLHRRGAPTA